MAEKTYRIPTVLSADELMDKAFHRASKITMSGANALDSVKKTTLAKVSAVGDIVGIAVSEEKDLKVVILVFSTCSRRNGADHESCKKDHGHKLCNEAFFHGFILL